MASSIVKSNAIEDEVLAPVTLTIPNISGMKLSDNNPANFDGQLIYVDFDGANNVTYNNAALNINIDNIDVANSGLDQTRINKIISELNTVYAGSGVYFTIATDSSRDLSNSSLLTPNASLASTIYVGSTGSAFAQYGNFLGLSETIDVGNQIKNDNAYVFSDKINSDVTITETIAHEAGHLLGFEHENSPTGTLNAYGLNYTGQIEGFRDTGFFGWYYRYDVAVNGDSQVTLTVDMQFDGDDPGDELLKQWIDGIERIWSNQYSLVDGNLSLPIVIDVNEVFSDADQVVTVHAGSGTGRTDMINWYTTSPGGWPNDYQDEVAAHEFGHMLGLYDEYTGGAVSPEGLIDHNSLMGADLDIVRERYFFQVEQWAENKTGREMSLINTTIISIAVTDAIAGEPNNNGGFRISRTGLTSSALTVYFSNGGTATSGRDYALNKGSTTLTSSVVIAAGQSYVDVTLAVIDDSVVESTETVIMNLATNAAYSLGATTSGTINISDNDVDTAPPTVPTDLKQIVNGNGVALDWADATDATSGVKRYEYQVDNNSNFLSNEKSGTVASSNVNATGLADGSYFWRVRTQDNSGNYSAWTTGDNFTVDITAPAIPASLTNIVTGNGVALDWVDATDATSGVKQYEYQIDNNSDFSSNEKSGTATASNANATGMTDGNYYWRVRTQDNSGNYSAWTAGSNFTVSLPKITIAVQDAIAGELADNGIFRITRTGDTTSALTVYFSIGGTATLGSDYTLKNVSIALTTSVEIAADKQFVDVTLAIIDDPQIETTETATINLTENAAAYTLGATTSATINITDNDTFTPIVSSQTVHRETVNSGTQSIVKNGISNSATIRLGGYQNISSGGVTNATLVNGGGQHVSSGGTANATTVSKGSQVISYGGIANGAVISSGMWQGVSSGGMANNTILNAGWQYVYGGGLASATTVNSAGYQILSSGGIASGTMVNANGKMYVSSGGVANTATVNVYGSQNIYAGGVANATLVNGGGQHVSGGTANATTVSKGSQVIYTGGIANGAVISSGMWQGASSGGKANNTILNAGWQYVYGGGLASATTVNSAGYQILSSGAIASGTILNLSGRQIVSSGGKANATTVNALGSQNIVAGGVVSGTMVNANGKMYVSSGGVANTATVNVYGSQNIYAGGVANATLVNGGGQHVSGGTANATTVSKGSQVIYTGGIANGAVISSGMWQGASSGGKANNTILNAGWQYVYGGGLASATTVNSLGYQILSSGAIASGTILNLSGKQIVSSGGKANATTVNTSGSQNIVAGGIASGTIINANGKMYVSSGGVANTPTINVYGSQNIYTGGIASATLVNGGGQYVSGGTANATTVNKGNQLISSGGIANNAVINSGTWQGVSSGGVANNTILNAGWQYVYGGGIASATTVNNGYQILSSGGTANGTIVNTNGKQIVSSGGKANVTKINTLGSQNIVAGGIASGTIINANGKMYVSSGGVANTATINVYGSQNIYAGGIASATLVNGGGQYVSGGIANSTTVSKGSQVIYTGGIANNAVISSGMWQGVYSGGKANNTVLNAGWQYVYGGGLANATTVNSAGYQILSSGGVASGTIVNLSGRQIVYAGGSANSATVNSGGSVFVSSGGILSGSLTINGGHATVAYGDNIQTPTVSFKLAAAQVNDALLVIQTGLVGNISDSTFNLNIDNTATGSYILADGANLMSMSSATFSVTDNGQNVNMQVGSSYTFADGDKLSLSFSDSTRDKLIAAFTNNPPASLPPIIFNPNAEVPAASTFDNAKIVDSVEQSGWVSLAGNDDDYRFDLASPVTGGTLRLHDLTGGNADLSLYNVSGTLLQSSNNTGTLDDSIISNLAAGTYFARVNAVSGNIDYKLDFDQKYVTGMLAS